MSPIGDKIKERRLELGLTLEQVGKAVGVGKSTVRKWETGYIQNMKRDKISLLAQVLNISPADLIDAYIVQEVYSEDEKHLITVFRAADPVYQKVAVDILEAHPADREEEKEGYA